MNREQIEQQEPDVDELLTSYLDDELSTEDRQQVEDRLRADIDFRGRLNQLQRAWDMLDELPKTELTFDFTRSTVEMVATKAAEDAESSHPNRRVKWGLTLGLLGVVLSGAAGFFVVYTALDSPNRRLMSDMPMLERLDEYRYAEDIQFLEMLDDAGLFAEEEPTDDSM